MQTLPNTAYSLEGRQGAPFLVLANSLGATPEMWNAQMPAWRKEFQVLRFSYRGHGDTAPLGTLTSVERLAQDLLSLLDHLNIQRFGFAGVSLGGMLGLHLAATVPQRVERLVAANFRYYQTEVTRPQWDQRIALVREQGIDAIVDATADRWLTEASRRQNPEVDARIRAMIRSTSSDGYIACAQAVRDYDARSFLGKISCPVLLVSGSEDVAAPAAHIDELDQLLKTSSHVTLPAAHLSNIERGDEFAQLIVEFALRERPAWGAA